MRKNTLPLSAASTITRCRSNRAQSRSHVDSRRRRRAGSGERGARGDRGDRSQDRMGSAGGGDERVSALRNSGARRAYQIAQTHAGRAQGAARDAGRGRMALDQRASAAHVRPLRQRAADDELCRSAYAVQQRRSDRRAREYRGSVFGNRARDRAGRGREYQGDHGARVAANREVRVRVRADASAQIGHRDSQSQYHEAVGRAVPEMRARGVGELQGRFATRSKSSTLPACGW